MVGRRKVRWKRRGDGGNKEEMEEDSEMEEGEVVMVGRKRKWKRIARWKRRGRLWREERGHGRG